MHTLAAFVFYGGLACGGLAVFIGFFRMGFYGMNQLRATLFPTLVLTEEQSQQEKGAREGREGQGGERDDLKRTVEMAATVAGVPTSLADFAFSGTPVAPLQAAATAMRFLAPPPSAVRMAVVSMGGVASRIFFFGALPFLALEIGLQVNGVKYAPHWITKQHLTGFNALAAAVMVCVFAYLLGKSIPSPTRDFNDARISYEHIRDEFGYWFDNRDDPSHYRKCMEQLALTLKTFERQLKRIGRDPGGRISRQRGMVLEYQRALVLATLALYDRAFEALREAQRLRMLLGSSEAAKPGADQGIESLLLFLEGELRAVRGELERARELFERSKSIDVARHDSIGIKMNDDRLAEIAGRA